MKRNNKKNSVPWNKFIETKPILFLLNAFHGTRQLIRNLYGWVIGWAEKKQAEKALAGISFAESSFFPIPPDPLLIAMVTAKPQKYIRFAIICTLASVIGGIFGYLIGSLLFESVGKWIIDTYHLQEKFITVGNLYNEYAFLALLVAGFSPIPYKLFAIAAGVFHVSIPLFIVASIIGRGGRFFLVAILMYHFGKRYKDKIEQYIDILSLAFVTLFILGVLAVKFLL